MESSRLLRRTKRGPRKVEMGVDSGTLDGMEVQEGEENKEADELDHELGLLLLPFRRLRLYPYIYRQRRHPFNASEPSKSTQYTKAASEFRKSYTQSEQATLPASAPSSV
ncbi:hypothetical protein NLJ89_g6217 [Agrocybe chaxingu]|uniref:Uncharacterized protein n=1 Tax=Agrocybe chaxingu TaxID=84603 RepID=A0A9W8MW84_9AGAR|nr:hypothetical protein NLJ89_g6217 [Agrocybe chaxingu]